MVNNANIEPKTVQGIPRHSRIQTTLDLYTQQDSDQAQAAQGQFLVALSTHNAMVQIRATIYLPHKGAIMNNCLCGRSARIDESCTRMALVDGHALAELGERGRCRRFNSHHHCDDREVPSEGVDHA